MLDPNLRYLSLPYYFTRLLQTNMQQGEESFEGLSTCINSNPSFLGLVQRCFKDIDESVNLRNIIKAHGWYGFRNRMAAIFLEYQLNGNFPLRPNLDFCNDLLELEESVKKSTVDGFSRAFLLGFYWKLHRYKDNNSFIEDFKWDEILKYFSYTKARVVKIDWLIFIIIHLHACLGEEVLLNALKSGADYEGLYGLLDEKQKQLYIKNALSYGASINEAEFFYQSRV